MWEQLSKPHFQQTWGTFVWRAAAAGPKDTHELHISLYQGPLWGRGVRIARELSQFWAQLSGDASHPRGPEPSVWRCQAYAHIAQRLRSVAWIVSSHFVCRDVNMLNAQAPHERIATHGFGGFGASGVSSSTQRPCRAHTCDVRSQLSLFQASLHPCRARARPASGPIRAHQVWAVALAGSRGRARARNHVERES